MSTLGKICTQMKKFHKNNVYQVNITLENSFKQWFWPILQITTKNEFFWPYLLHFSFFIKIKKSGTATWTIPNHYCFILFHMGWIILFCFYCCWHVGQYMYILEFGPMEDSLRLNKDLYSTKVYLLPILKSTPNMLTYNAPLWGGRGPP